MLRYSACAPPPFTGTLESAITKGAAAQPATMNATGSMLPHASHAVTPTTAANSSESHEERSMSFNVNFSDVFGVTANTAFLPNSPAATVHIIIGASEAYVATFTRKYGISSSALRLLRYTNRSGIMGEHKNSIIIAYTASEYPITGYPKKPSAQVHVASIRLSTGTTGRL